MEQIMADGLAEKKKKEIKLKQNRIENNRNESQSSAADKWKKQSYNKVLPLLSFS